MSKIIKIVGCILAAIGLGCIVKHIVMYKKGELGSCSCLADLKNKHLNTMSALKGKCGCTKSSEKAPNDAKKITLDEAIDQYTNGEITREQFDEIRKTLV